ncbi:hypothetical protein [Brevundimonas nasdae]|uniref:hypothetical protein n=1 Tax=Brevundimonas nasdae TaxID=172043 RepID=UPI003F692231
MADQQSFAQLFAQVWRDFKLAGVPASGANEPEKAAIRAIGQALDLALAAASVGDLEQAIALLQPIADEATAARDGAISALEALQITYPTIGLWIELVVDQTQRITSGVKMDGSRWEARGGVLVEVSEAPIMEDNSPTYRTLIVTDRLDAPGLPATYPTIGLWRSLDLDSSGRIVLGERLDGSRWEARGGVLVQISGGGSPAPSYAYDYLTGSALTHAAADIDYIVIGNGQSWQVGGKNGSSGDGTVTTSAQHPGYALMFDAGVRPNGGAVSSYVDLHEQDMGGSFETMMSGMADLMMKRLGARLGFKPRIVFVNAANGGQAYFDKRGAGFGLKRGTVVYAEGLRLIQRAAEISRAAGRRAVVLAQVISHGEQDFSDGVASTLYQRALDQWNAHINEDWRAITGQIEPIRTYVTQVNRGGSSVGTPAATALAQLAAEDRNPMIRCVGPMYQAPGGSPGDGNDGAHLKAIGYRMIGRLVGHFLTEDLFGPYEQPLRVIDSWWVSSTAARLKYSKPIAVETTNALINVTGLTASGVTYPGLGADGGVKFTDGSVSPPTVTGIAVVGGDTLEVTFSAPSIGKNPRLTIAAHRASGNGSGSERGARSAIRSTASFDTDALTGVVQYHWACQEQVVLPAI